MARTWRLFYTTSHHFKDTGETFSSRKKGYLSGQVCVVGETEGYWLLLENSCEPLLSCIVAVTVNFLILLLLLVNYSYLNLLCLPFSSPAFSGEMGMGKKGSKWAAYALKSLSGSTKFQSSFPKPEQLSNPLQFMCTIYKSNRNKQTDKSGRRHH